MLIPVRSLRPFQEAVVPGFGSVASMIPFLSSAYSNKLGESEVLSSFFGEETLFFKATLRYL